MFSSRCVMALLALLALSAKVAGIDIAAPEACSADDAAGSTNYCLNCKTKAECVTEGDPPVATGTCTVPGEACNVLAGVATCTANPECVCGDADSMCDPYDGNSLLICLSTGGTYIVDCSATGQSCVNGECATPASTTTTVAPDEICVAVPDNTIVISKPMCTTGAYCIGDAVEIPFDCPSGYYLDVAAKGCKPLPPDSCAGCVTAVCPDKSDCSKYHICEDGVSQDVETCDAATPVFDTVTSECVPETPGGTCTANAGCTYGLTTVAATPTAIVSPSDGTSIGETSTSSGSDPTTSGSGSTTSGSGSTTSGSDSTTSGTGSTGDSSTTTSRPATCTAANVGQRYPYEGNCKMYWKCAEEANGTYTYVAFTCLGDYVFNPETGYCDLLANVPGCVVPPS